VLVIPSVISRGGLGKEGFSLVALEAMGVGTPVVAYDYRGPPEVLGDCVCWSRPASAGRWRKRLSACSKTRICRSASQGAAAGGPASASRFPQ
jgi:hypothetical protein